MLAPNDPTAPNQSFGTYDFMCEMEIISEGSSEDGHGHQSDLFGEEINGTSPPRSDSEDEMMIDLDRDHEEEMEMQQNYRLFTTASKPLWSEFKHNKYNVQSTWNERFQHLLETISESSCQEMEELLEEFKGAIIPIVKQVIDEVALDDSMKTFVPQSINGTGGGAKFIHNGIIYKLVDERTVRLYGGETAAGKVYAAELRANNAVLVSGLDHITLPMSAIVTYKGLRVYAACLVPIDNSTLVYGSNNTGKDIMRRKFAQDVMSEVGKTLNLAKHMVMGKTGNIARIIGPIDMECHHSLSDGRLYFLDTTRLYPLFPPNIHRFCFLRPELVKSNHVPLSSDAFSRFSDKSFSCEYHHRNVLLAARRLDRYIIPSCADHLCSNPPASVEELVVRMHRFGINVRWMGKLAILCKTKQASDELIDLIHFEMICRSFKRYLYANLPRRIQVSILQKSSTRFSNTQKETTNTPRTRSTSRNSRWGKTPRGRQKHDSIVSIDSFTDCSANVIPSSCSSFTFSKKWSSKIRSGSTVEVIACQLFDLLVNDSAFWKRLMNILVKKFNYTDPIEKTSLDMKDVLHRIGVLTGFWYNTSTKDLQVVPIAKTCFGPLACKMRFQRDPEITKYCYDRRIEVAEARLGLYNSQLAPIYNNAIKWYERRGEWKQTIPYYNRLIDIYTSIYSCHSLLSDDRVYVEDILSETFFNAATAASKCDMFDKSLEYLSKYHKYNCQYDQEEVTALLSTLATNLENEGHKDKALIAKRLITKKSSCCSVQ